MKRSVFRIDKMDCATEERMIRSALEHAPGVESLDFNLMARTLTVDHSDAMTTAHLVAAVAAVGMEAIPQTPGVPRIELPIIEAPFWRRASVVTTALSGLFAVAAEILAWTSASERTLSVRLLAGAAIVIGGYQMLTKAALAVRALSLNIHILMALAVVGAIALGDWSEAAVVIFLFALAELVEARSLDRARNAIHGLMRLAPATTRVVRNGAALDVPTGDVAAGEIVRMRPGERLPLDGMVVDGTSAVNQAPITGESIPVQKSLGDAVMAGSLNGSGTFDYSVTHVANESTIARIAALVETATSRRGRTERFVDRFSAVYTPAIFVVALLVAITPPLLLGRAWDVWLYNGLVLLVIGCPCALVISTPVTIVSGLAAAARRGILIKGGEYLERGRLLRVIAFDKTGTLTEARPRVTDVTAFGDCTEDHLVHLAGAVEARSEHPIAAAIVTEHNARHIDEAEIAVTAFEALAGRGARGLIDGETIWTGNHRLAHELGVCSDEVEHVLDGFEEQGKTTVAVMNSRRVLGVIAVADGLRPSSAGAVGDLRALGLQVAMLTGDSPRTAIGIARQLGIEDVRAGLLPADKITALQAIEEAHGPVGMVGEGYNDVPALAQASIGFVMGAIGSDAAIEAADVALMNDDLGKVPEFIRLSHRTLRVLKQNIAIALGLKSIFFALALMGMATLWMAVFADMGASLIVVANGLRLLRAAPRTA